MQRDLQDCSMLCFCETWLGGRTPDEAITLHSYAAFNTTFPDRLTVKLTDLGAPTPNCNWILDFLTERPHVVRMGGRVSVELTVSTGMPQGYCHSPKLFTLHTHDTISTQDNAIITRNADDTPSSASLRGEGRRLRV